MYGHLRFIRVYISFVSLRVRFCFYDSLFEAQTSNIYICIYACIKGCLHPIKSMECDNHGSF